MNRSARWFFFALLIYAGEAICEDAPSADPRAEVFRTGMRHLRNDDLPAAVSRIAQAAEQGYSPAEHTLCRLYLEGRGVEKNGEAAEKWCSRAAKSGHKAAQAQLARMYEDGTIVTRDFRRALLYWIVAEGYDSVSSNAARVEKQLSRADITRAREEAARFQPAREGEASAASIAEMAPVYVIGGSIKPPVPTFHPPPELTTAASEAQVDGAVLLRLIVRSDGTPTDIKVLRPLAFGLNQKAIEAVRRWRFKPATKNGEPVAVLANVEIDFRFLRPMIAIN